MKSVSHPFNSKYPYHLSSSSFFLSTIPNLQKTRRGSLKLMGTSELAGQLLNIPTICNSSTIETYQVTSCSLSSTTDGKGTKLEADEIRVPIKFILDFKIPLVPEGARRVPIDTTLVIFSSKEFGRIVRLQDRPDDNLPNNAFMSVCSRNLPFRSCVAKGDN